MDVAPPEQQVEMPSQERAPRLAHNPALDGLRGVAVIMVVLYHTHLIRGGWIGVEVFFVLSGYLITSLLVAEIDRSGRVDLVGFWRRRARRLLPGLFMVLGVVAVFVRVISPRTAYADIRRDVLAALTYSSNWVSIYGGGGYWQHFSAPSPLKHMWSLAVEEQFYLVYPLLATVILRAAIRRWLVLALTVAALAWQLWMSFHSGLDRFYLGADTRAFGILVGASIALYASHHTREIARWFAPLAVLVLVAASAWFDGGRVSTFHGPFQLVSLATGVVILATAPLGDGALGSLLSHRFITAIGRWSYGIYLVHWPIAEALRQRYGLSPWPVTLIVVPVSLLVAAASLKLIESPIRHRGLAAFGIPRLTLLAAGVLATLAITSTVVDARKPLDASDVAAVDAPVVSVPDDAPVTTLPAGPVGLTPRPVDRPYRIMLVGDSVGDSLKAPLEALAGDLGIEVFSRAAPSCSYDQERTVGSPEFTEDQSCVDIVHGWRADVQSYRPDLVLFVYGSWSGWTYQDAYRTQCDPVLAGHVQDLYGKAVADLGATGAPVYMVAPGYWRADGTGPDLDRAYDCLRDVMQRFVSANSTTTAYIDVHSLVCSGSRCDAAAGGQLVRPDGLHFAGPGGQTIAVTILQHAIEPPAAGWPAVTAIDCC